MKNKLDLSIEQNSKYILKTQNDESDNSFLRQKRKSPFEYKEELKEKIIKDNNFCNFCNNKIGENVKKDKLDNNQINNINNLIFNEKKEISNNSIFDSVNNPLINDEKKKNFKNNCLCNQKKSKNESNKKLNKTNPIDPIDDEGEELKLIYSTNKEIEGKIKEIINDFDNFDEEKDINDKDNNNLINQIKNKLEENFVKFKENYQKLEKLIENKYPNINENENENESLNKLNKIQTKNKEKNIINNKNEKEKAKDYQIFDKNSITFLPNYELKSDSLNSYIILTK